MIHAPGPSIVGATPGEGRAEIADAEDFTGAAAAVALLCTVVTLGTLVVRVLLG